MRLVKLLALVAALTAAGAVAAQPSAGQSWGPETPNFNLQAVLRPAAAGPAGSFGLVKFRQPNDADKIVYLNVWVRDLAPDQSYYLERATDSVANDDCLGMNWLRLGQGLTTTAIETDHSGTGRATLFRSLALIPIGTSFDIQFRVVRPVDAVNSEVVLESGCYQFTVSQ
jgi:hypothetical protein